MISVGTKGVLLIVLVLVFSGFAVGFVVADRKMGNGRISRETHKCEIAGRRLDCQRHSAWFTGSRCRCITNGTVFRWTEGE